MRATTLPPGLCSISDSQGGVEHGQRKRRLSQPLNTVSRFVRQLRYTDFPMRWCTVTGTDQDGRRHSVDVQATSTFDAAHLFVVEAKKERAVGLPKPTLATVFEVVAAGKVYRVTGTALQTWIVEKRRSWNGPKGYLFCKRPGLE